MTQQHKQMIERVALEAAEQCFVPSHRRPDNLEERKLEGLGIRLSQWAGYDGLALMRIAYSALEDSNFHTEAGIIYEWLQKATNEEVEP